MKIKSMVLIGAAIFCCMLIESAAVLAQDNGNGTVTVAGKIWLKDAGCIGLGLKTWDTAKSNASGMVSGRCGLSDQSVAGDWRLPTQGELLDVFSSKSLFLNVQSSYYWSGSTSNSGTPWSCHVNGTCLPLAKSNLSYVWLVRTR